MKRIYLFLSALLLCGGLFAQSPVTGQKYNIKHVATGMYLQYLANGDGDFCINDLVSGGAVFDFDFTPLSGESDTYNIGVGTTTQYLGGSGWKCTLNNAPATANGQIILVPGDGTFQLRGKWSSGNWINVDAITAGSRIYANKGSSANSVWQLELSANALSPDDLLQAQKTLLLTALQTGIANATAFLSSTSAGTNPGEYPQTAYTAFQTAIAAAQASYDNLSASADDVNDIITALNTAIDNLNTALQTYAETMAPYVDTDKYYYISNKDSEFYLSLPDGATADTRVNLRALANAFPLKFTNVGGRPGIYTVQRLTGEYLYQNDYYVRFNATPALSSTITNTVKIAKAANGYLTIQWVDKSGDNYLGINNATAVLNENTAANKTATGNVYWTFAEANVTPPTTVEINALSPANNATGILTDATLSVTFTGIITAASDLSGITINGVAASASISGAVLTIAHETFAYNTLYTVSIPAGAITEYAGAINWSFTTREEPAPIVAPQAGKKYNIKHVDTGLYFTINEQSGGSNVTLIDEFTGDDAQSFELLADASNPANFNISVSGKYLTQHATWAWDATLGTDPAANGAEFKLVTNEQGTTIQALSYSGNQYLAPQATAPGTTCYLNSTSSYYWIFEEVNEAVELDVKTLTPLANANNASLNTPISVLFTKAIEAADLTGITIKDAENIVVDGVTGAVNGSRLTITYTGTLAYETTYTVTVPAGAITGYNQAITWSFTTVSPFVLNTDKEYYINYHNTDFYIGRVDNNATTRVSIQAKDDDYLVQFFAVEDRPDIYNIKRVSTGEYLYQDGYFVRFAASPTISANVTTNVKLQETENGITIQWIDKTGNNYFGVNSTASGQNTAADKASNGFVFWQLEEYIEPETLEISELTPLDNATLVASTTAISVLFNKTITASDLALVNIKNSANEPVADVVATIAGKRLNIAHAKLANEVTYTVTVPAGAINGYDQPIIWSFTTANPVLPKEPRSYHIINVNTGLYLTLPETAPAADSRFAVAAKIDGEDAQRQIFRFLNPEPNNPDIFNIAVFSGEYMAKQNGSAWAMELSEDPASQDAQVTIIPDGINIKIQVLTNAGQERYLGQNTATVATCYWDKNHAQSVWRLEQIVEPIALYKTTPANGSTGVALNVDVKASFNQSVTAVDLTTITIKDAQGNAVTGVSATLDDYILSIAHAELAYGTAYTVTIPVGAIAGLTEAVSWSFTTQAPPSVDSTTPATDATNVAINVSVKVFYTEAVTAESLTGITIKNAAGTAVADVNATLAEEILTINHAALEYETVYTVTIPAGAIKGVVGAYSWSFTTTAAPVVKSTTPADNAENVALATLIRVTFDKSIIEGAAGLSGVSLKNAAGEDISGTKSISGSALSIAKATGVQLANNTLYTVTVPANTIKGVTEEIKFSFTTIKGTAIDEVDNSQKVSVYPSISKGNITVSTDEPATISIVNITGAKLAAYRSEGNKTISLDYANGLYIIVVESNGNISSHKVILKK